MSVAELCRRLGPVPATADSLATGATPVLVGDLLRREGRPLTCPDVSPEIPQARADADSGPDADRATVPASRSRAEACKTALGAGGLVVAGSVLGAALLAAAGVGGPLPSFQGDNGAEQFQGEGTVRGPSKAYGSVTGRDVVYSSGLLRTVSYYAPWGNGPPAPTAARPAATTAQPVPVPLQNGGLAVPSSQVAPGGGGAAPVLPRVDLSPAVGGAGEGIGTAGGGATQGVGTLANGATRGVDTLTNGATQGVGTVVSGAAQSVTPIVRSVVAPLERVVPQVAAVVAPAAARITGLVEPVAGLVDVTEPPAVLAGPVATEVAPAEGLPSDGFTAPLGAAGQVVRDAPGSVGAALPSPTAAAASVVQNTTDVDTTLTDTAGTAVTAVQDVAGAASEAVPPAVRAAATPTAEPPAVAPLASDDGLSAVEEAPAEPTRLVPPVDPEHLDPPTTPRRVITSEPPDSDGPQNRAETDDETGSGDGQDDAEEDDVRPEPRRIPAVESVRDAASELLGR